MRDARKRHLAALRKARGKRAAKRGARFVEFAVFNRSHGLDVESWLALHVGILRQRIEELEARVARMEGRKL